MFLLLETPFHPSRGWFLKNPFLVVSYIMIGTYIPNFTFLAPVVSALRCSSVSQFLLIRVSVTPCGFRGGRNGVWVGFLRGFSRFPLPQISFHHFSTLISSISFHFISPCDGAPGVVGRHPCHSLTYNIGASSHLIPRPDLVLDTSWGYLLINWGDWDG